MKFKYLFLYTIGIMLTSSLSYAKSPCNVESFQAIDITTEVKGGVLDKESGQFLITEKPMMRCANITFSTAHTRNRVAHMMNQGFEAVYYDGNTSKSHSVTFDEDDLKAGYVKIGPNHPKTAYVCFTTSETPINTISCDIK
ncbi:hypothetical protein [Vibrio sp. D54]|uniref:hypothetical protein n=1 Tax=Vibrio sp. D54 TaxID=2912256 RepID=UPI001F25B4E2|nr:hypothetical protein [Vibrio sp. D54]MCF7511000.1 hypothetical protein [Vibrio sp. D54]